MSGWQDERMEAPRIGPLGYALAAVRGLLLVVPRAGHHSRRFSFITMPSVW